VRLEELEALLLVQERDTALDQLRHRREAMPERAEVEARAAALRRAEAERLTRERRPDLWERRLAVQDPAAEHDRDREVE